MSQAYFAPSRTVRDLISSRHHKEIQNYHLHLTDGSHEAQRHRTLAEGLGEGLPAQKLLSAALPSKQREGPLLTPK